MQSKRQLLRRSSSVLFICAYLGCHTFAQVNYRLENAKFDFPDTRDMRSRIAEIQSDLRFVGDQIAKLKLVLDCTQRITSVQDDSTKIAILDTMIGVQSAFSSQVKMTKDNYVTMLGRLRDLEERIAKVQIQASQAVKVDGTIYDKLPTAKVYFVRQRKSTDVYVITTSKVHNLGDEVTGYYRKIADQTVVLDSKRRWQVLQKGKEPSQAISSFDLYEETVEVVEPSDLTQLQEEHRNAAKELSSFFQDAFTLLASDIKIRTNELTINRSRLTSDVERSERELYLKNLFIAGQVATEKADGLSALNAFFALYNEDKSYDDVAAKLEAARRTAEVKLRLLLFGEHGLKNMVIIPAGKCELSSGESFKSEIFLIDSLAVTNEQFEYFEKVTGYKPQKDWRAFYNETTANRRVLNLADADKAKFAEWAGKMLPSANEIEYISASGFESLTEKYQYLPSGSLYGVIVNAAEFRCVVPLTMIPEDKQSEIEDKADMIKDAVKDKINQLIP